MRKIEIEIAETKVNLQCGSTVKWNQYFPEIVPAELQPYVNLEQLEESWNSFSSEHLERILQDFNRDIQPTLRFHFATCIFSLLALVGNVVIALVSRRNNTGEIYPIICMIVIFLALIVTQYRTVMIFQETLNDLTRRMQKHLARIFLRRNASDRFIRQHSDDFYTSNLKSFELIVENSPAGTCTGSTRILKYKVLLFLGDGSERSEGNDFAFNGNSNGSIISENDFDSR